MHGLWHASHKRGNKSVEFKFFEQQKTLFDQAITAIKDGHRYILIAGTSGCGKTFLSNRLCE